MAEKLQISLIDYKGFKNESLRNILSSINGYLLRNKGAVSDFNLVKDIVDRNVDKVDDEISNNIPTPLYLGLMGTMLGIVGGLLFMPEISTDVAQQGSENVKDENALVGIDALLNGVKIAMFASVSGLFFTILSNYFFFKARKEVEHQKHDFFTFIQTQLLPILSKNTSSSIYSLQTNLLRFNKEFSDNMKSFSYTVNEVKETFDSQLEVVQQLKRIDVANIAKYNIDVMQQLQASFEKLHKLAEYLDNVNGMIGNTRELNLAVNDQLKKVGEISELVKSFDHNASTISDNSHYLKSHFKNIDDREQAINDRLAEFDKNTGKIIDSLEESFRERLKSFNDKDVEINSSFQTLFEELREKTREVFDDESNNIKAIKKEVENIDHLSGEMSSLNQNINQQNESMKKLITILNNRSPENKFSKPIMITAISIGSLIIITCLSVLYKIFFS